MASIEIDDIVTAEDELDEEKKMELLQEKEAKSRAEVLEIVSLHKNATFYSF